MRYLTMAHWFGAASLSLGLSATACGGGGAPGAGESANDDEASSSDESAGESGAEAEAESGDGDGDNCEASALARLDTYASEEAIADLVASDTHIYACGEALGLVALPYSDAGFGSVQTVSTEGCKRIAMSADGERIAVSSPSRGEVRVYARSDDGALTESESTQSIESPEGMAIDGDRLWVAAREAGVYELAIGDGLSVTQSAVQVVEEDARDVVLGNDDLVVAAGRAGLRRQSKSDLSVSASRPLVGVAYDIGPLLDEGSRSWTVATMEGAALLSDDADLSLRAEVSSFGVGLGAVGLPTQAGPRVLLADWNGLRQLDAADPNLLTQGVATIGGTSPGVRAVAVGAQGDASYVFTAGVFGVTMQRASAFGCDAPAISSQVRELVFAPTATGTSLAKVLQIRNEGTRTLTGGDLVSDHPEITVLPSNFELAPGQIGALEITFTPSDDSVLDGVLRFSTDDPDDPEFEVPYVANRAGLAVGDPAPELSMVDLEGDYWSNQSLIGKVSLLAYFATW